MEKEIWIETARKSVCPDVMVSRAVVTHVMKGPSDRSTTLFSFVALEKSIEAVLGKSSNSKVSSSEVLVKQHSLKGSDSTHRKPAARDQRVRGCRNTRPTKLSSTDSPPPYPAHIRAVGSEHRSAGPIIGAKRVPLPGADKPSKFQSTGARSQVGSQCRHHFRRHS